MAESTLVETSGGVTVKTLGALWPLHVLVHGDTLSVRDDVVKCFLPARVILLGGQPLDHEATFDQRHR